MIDNDVNTYVTNPVRVEAILVSKENVENVIKFLGDSFVSVDINNDCILFNQFGLKGVLVNDEYYLVRSHNIIHSTHVNTFKGVYMIVK